MRRFRTDWAVWRTGSLPVLAALLVALSVRAQTDPEGFQSALFGEGSAAVKGAVGAKQWVNTSKGNGFPPALNITTFDAPVEIAGYPAKVTFFFCNDTFFQATARFQFPKLVNFDFNYNVFRSVDEYYRAIRDQSLTFTYDIFSLLEKKYGKKEPVFEGLDPRKVFQTTDSYVLHERWNLRYHPYDYYKKIVAAAYARWNFPKTRITFSVNISAADKRFDYLLSLTSLDLERRVNRGKDELRYKGL